MRFWGQAHEMVVMPSQVHWFRKIEKNEFVHLADPT